MSSKINQRKCNREAAPRKLKTLGLTGALGASSLTCQVRRTEASWIPKYAKGCVNGGGGLVQQTKTRSDANPFPILPDESS
eukprot:987433-Amphidinium_carterae.1